MNYSKRIWVFFIVLFSFFGSSGIAQNTAIYPTEGKAVIYLVRTPGVGALMNFKFFEKDRYIGKFNGSNFIRYESDPGKSIFWVKAENMDFVETDLKAGRIYILEARAKLGALSANVKFRLVDYTDAKQMARINKVVETNEGVTFTEEELKKKQLKMASMIQKNIRKIHKKRKKKPSKTKHITPEMNYTN